MAKKYSKLILIILWIILAVIVTIYWEHKFIPEILTCIAYCIPLYLFLRSVLQKTNDKRIVIKTKKFNWIPMIGWMILGTVKIVSKTHPYETLIFGSITESGSQGIGFILMGIASFPRNIIIDHDGIKINDWLTALIKYDDLTEIKLTHENLSVSNKSFSYYYKIFKASDSTIEQVNRKIEEKCFDNIQLK